MDKFCVKCGAQRQNQTKFCINCGHEFSYNNNENKAETVETHSQSRAVQREGQKRRRKWYLLLILFLLVTIGIGAGLFYKGYSADKSELEAQNSEQSNKEKSKDKKEKAEELERDKDKNEHSTDVNKKGEKNDKDAKKMEKRISKRQVERQLNEIYDLVEQGANDSFQVEEDLIDYFSQPDRNKKYQDLLEYIDLSQRRKDFDAVYFSIDNIAINRDESEFEVIYDLTYHTTYTDTKPDRIQTFQIVDIWKNDNKNPLIVTNESFEKIYDNEEDVEVKSDSLKELKLGRYLFHPGEVEILVDDYSRDGRDVNVEMGLASKVSLSNTSYSESFDFPKENLIIETTDGNEYECDHIAAASGDTGVISSVDLDDDFYNSSDVSFVTYQFKVPSSKALSKITLVSDDGDVIAEEEL